MQTMWGKQWALLIKKEEAYAKDRQTKKQTKLDEFLEQKVPEKLQSTLNKAFAKSFEVIFDKGTQVIEKSYNKSETELKYKLNEYALSLKKDKKRMRAFEKEANVAEAKNVLISGVKGVGLGFLGIGLPDIPIFLGMVLKGVYETALQYGFSYETEEDRYFILSVINGALSYGEEYYKANEAIDEFIKNPVLPSDYSREANVNKVAQTLTNELLCMKFLQGLPIVGMVGGVADAVFVKRIISFSKLKYKRRFLQNKMSD